MEDNKLNLVEILKDAPRGTKLYSTIFGAVELDLVVSGDMYPIYINRKLPNSNRTATVTANGKYLVDQDGECTLFPSKENRDWSTFKVEPQFPMTYEECSIELNLSFEERKYRFFVGATDMYGRMLVYKDDGLYFSELNALHKLLVCRDAWWKVDGGWKPDWEDKTLKFGIANSANQIEDVMSKERQRIFAFRTAKMRDKFLETFRDLIEQCKEFL